MQKILNTKVTKRWDDRNWLLSTAICLSQYYFLQRKPSHSDSQTVAPDGSSLQWLQGRSLSCNGGSVNMPCREAEAPLRHPSTTHISCSQKWLKGKSWKIYRRLPAMLIGKIPDLVYIWQNIWQKIYSDLQTEMKINQW